MRRALVLVALVALGCTPAAVPVPVESPVARTERAVDVAIDHTVLLDDPGCTGVRIGDGLVLTAKHCMNGRVVGDIYSNFTVKYVSPAYDFAVMSGDGPTAGVILQDALIGEHLYVVGYPQSVDDLKQYLTVTDGIFAGPSSYDQERITAYGYYGNSGGGVWNDSGELIGILVTMRPSTATYGPSEIPVPMPAHSFMVPVRFIRLAMAAHAA